MKTNRISIPVMLTLACALPGSSEAAVALNQIGDVDAYLFGAAIGNTYSQIFTDFPSYDCTLIEDFTVTSTALRISQVSALFRAQGGFLSFQDVLSYDLNIYSAANLAATSLAGDRANLTVLASAALIEQIHNADSNNTDEYGLVTLNVDISLPAAGTYWVGLSPRSAFSVTGGFFLMNSGATGGAVTPGNATAELANPAGGLGAAALTVLNRDFAYSVTVVPEPSAITLWLLTCCGWLCRRQRPRQA